MESDRTFEPFKCPFCAGSVELRSTFGLTRQIRLGVFRSIPPEITIPKCDGCGETFLDEEDSKRIDVAIEEEESNEVH